MVDYNILDVDALEDPPSLEIIKWEDHYTAPTNDWQPIKKYIQPDYHAMIFSVGWVVYEDEHKLVLLSTVDRSSNNATGDFAIVKAAIVKRWRLSDPSHSKRKK